MRSSVRRASAALLLLAPLTVAPMSSAQGAPQDRRATPAPLHTTARAIPDQYIVTLRQGVDPAAFVSSKFPGLVPLFTYGAALNGFAARLTPLQLETLRGLPGTEAVEQDAVAGAFGEEGRGGRGGLASRAPATSWGLDRIDQQDLPLDQQFTVQGTGKGVTVYVVDSGIDFQHPEFGGRAVAGYDAMGDGRNGQDCQGHGTHVAGIAAGATFGVAREASLVSVRVLGCDGKGTWSGIIAGLDWVAKNAKGPGVLNASLGGGTNLSVNAAANAVYRKGVLPVVAAGNDAVDACGISPAGSKRTFTVAASDVNDKQAGFSNFGRCINLYAPGTGILSAKLGGGSVTMDGTSMASPHVAGVAALYKAANPDATPEEVADWLSEKSTKNVLKALGAESANELLNTGGS
ncbi:S8 family peptidase [Kitasatospora sp. NPDC002040]|uniref:S8 family peptidase n=1 Tax=Kitasatospora sp. NPDC002040 TaxID=3154661 RepID=UPI00332D7C0A